MRGHLSFFRRIGIYTGPLGIDTEKHACSLLYTQEINTVITKSSFIGNLLLKYNLLS